MPTVEDLDDVQDDEEDFFPGGAMPATASGTAAGYEPIVDADTGEPAPMASSSQSRSRGPDPFAGADPWGNFGGTPQRGEPAYIRQAPTYGRRTRSEGGTPPRAPASSAFPQLGLPQERESHGPPKVAFDVPPSWDGKDPDNLLEPYQKLLGAWLATTRTLRTQQGVIILQHAKGCLLYTSPSPRD